MKTRHVLIKIRLANKDDFADQFGQKKIGVPYLQENALGVVEKRIYYFNLETEIVNFKKLYANNQIYVLENPNEVAAISEE